jgi:uncharacterized membrane protein YgdD (TMEM256/DUF423 family)
MNSPRLFLALGALGGFFSVAFGAFGAHVLQDRLSPHMFDIFNKAVHYQGWHALALLFTGLLMSIFPTPSLRWAGICFITGILLFSGSLYALSLSGIRGLGAITPLGGLSFLAGWLLLAIGGWKYGSKT